MKLDKEQLKLRRTEIQDCCEPLMDRREFRFNHLYEGRFIEQPMLDKLNLAKAYSQRRPDALEIFMDQFENGVGETDPRFKRKLERVMQKNGRDAAQVSRAIQTAFIEEDIFADFGRPMSAGWILEKEKILDIPVFYVLGEALEGQGDSTGRLSYGVPRNIDSVVLYVASAIGYFASMMDLWFSVYRDDPNPPVMARLANATEENLTEYCKDVLTPIIEEEGAVPVKRMLMTICNRSMIYRFMDMLEEHSDSLEFMVRNIDLNLRSARVHETAHLLERINNGPNLHPDKLVSHIRGEILAYLAQAVYSDAPLAFKLLYERTWRISRNGDIAQTFKGIYNELAGKGALGYLEKEEFVKRWAKDLLEAKCKEWTGKSRFEVFTPQILEAVAEEPILDRSHSEIIVEAMHLPYDDTVERVAPN